MLVVDNPRFRRRLVELIGQRRDFILSHNPVPARSIRGGNKTERLIWVDFMRDTGTDERFPIYYTVRLYDNIAWAVGIRADRFYFVFSEDAPEIQGFQASPKAAGDDPALTNWVIRDLRGLQNFGATA